MNILTSFLVTTGVLLMTITGTTTASAPTVQVPVQVPVQVQEVKVEIKTTPLTIREKVAISALKYHVDASDVWQTMVCENPELDPTKQSGYYYKGVREQSYGLVQINLPSHPDITYAEATDIDFSIDFISKNFALGNQWMWSCWKLAHGSR